MENIRASAVVQALECKLLPFTFQSLGFVADSAYPLYFLTNHVPAPCLLFSTPRKAVAGEPMSNHTATLPQKRRHWHHLQRELSNAVLGDIEYKHKFHAALARDLDFRKLPSHPGTQTQSTESLGRARQAQAFWKGSREGGVPGWALPRFGYAAHRPAANEHAAIEPFCGGSPRGASRSGHPPLGISPPAQSGREHRMSPRPSAFDPFIDYHRRRQPQAEIRPGPAAPPAFPDAMPLLRINTASCLRSIASRET